MNFTNIFDFLTQLKDNNQKAWLDNNRKLYETAKKDFEQIIKHLIQEIGFFDAQIAGLEAKACIFRLNRDIRFSKDKSPYKLNFGAFMQKGGKKTPLGGYYIHIQPGGESFLGGGIYMPEPTVLAKIRQEIDYNSAEFHQIIDSSSFKDFFGELWGEKVKTVPKGYDKDHPDIEILKLKSFTAFHQLSDAQVKAPDFFNHTLETFKIMKPLNDFLNRVFDSEE
ncbi:MAG: DUF2461 domain-containing protein [Microscillaceae bacterium]|nr:DUF2461 domain-containing protein [Microscillaceae bacterium]